jgi:hypothetical protein
MTLSLQRQDARKRELTDELRKEFTERGWSRIGTQLEDTLYIIESDSRAREALRFLMKAECNLAVLLQELYLYCGGTSQDFRIWRNQVSHARNELQAISTRLGGDANNIATIAEELLDEAYEPYASAFRIAAKFGAPLTS